MAIQSSGEGLSPSRVGEVIRKTQNRDSHARAGTQSAEDKLGLNPTSLPYKRFKQRHDDYDADYWAELDALYEGGKRLLGNDDLMRKLFPSHRSEDDEIYEERRDRAFYVATSGEILDHIMAELFAQPLQLEVGKKEQANWPEYYQDLFDDCSHPGGSRTSFNALLRDQMRNALICKTAWSLTEMPPAAPEAFDSQKSQEKAGAMNAYVVSVHPASVIDWDVDDNGELTFAILMTETNRRLGLDSDRDQVTKRFMVYDRESWQEWVIVHEVGKEPKDTDKVMLINDGVHSFKHVPLQRLELPAGLWAMNKLHSLAREHLNKRNALSWAEFQALFQELYEFLGPELSATGVVGENQMDTSRGTNQSRGQGFVQVRGKDDKAMFIGPTTAPFEHAMDSCKETRDEMYKVTHKMAMGIDPSAAATIGRSGESKEQDRVAMTIVLQALGQRVREHAIEVLQAISIGRGEEALGKEWKVEGMEQFDSISLGNELENGLSLQEIEIPSATFRILWLMDLVKAKLGDKASPEDLDIIEKELEASVTQDSMMPNIEIDAGDDDKERANLDDVDEDGTKPIQPKPQPGKKRMSGSPGMK